MRNTTSFSPSSLKKGVQIGGDTGIFRLVRVEGKVKNHTSFFNDWYEFFTSRMSFDASASLQGQQKNSYESRKTLTSRKNVAGTASKTRTVGFIFKVPELLLVAFMYDIPYIAINRAFECF
jgi:hypothetical protein